MNLHTTDLRGDLIEGEAVIPINIQFKTKYSFLVRPLNGHKFKDGDEYSNIVVQAHNDSFELGCCRVLAERNNGENIGRLIFIDDIYDLESLVYHHKLVKIQDEFLNLPLLLERKDLIHRSFKNFVCWKRVCFDKNRRCFC